LKRHPWRLGVDDRIKSAVGVTEPDER